MLNWQRTVERSLKQKLAERVQQLVGMESELRELRKTVAELQVRLSFASCASGVPCFVLGGWAWGRLLGC